MIKVDRKAVGRPRLSKDGSSAIFVKVPKQMKKQIESKAAAAGVSVSAFVRDLILKEIGG